MKIHCIWEHNGSDTLLYSRDYIGAFTRGSCLEEALSKMPQEILAYSRWIGQSITEDITPIVAEEHISSLDICDADSDVIFDSEKQSLTMEEYLHLKAITLKSAEDFLKMYDSISDKHSSSLKPKNTFIGPRPRTAHEMYEHTKCVNSYYFGEIGVSVSNDGSILQCRKNGFELLEKQAGFLSNTVLTGSYDEKWSLRKVLRRFIWHDRIHGKAMYRMATLTFGKNSVDNTFGFN